MGNWPADLQHFFSYAFNPWSWVTNITAEVVQILVIGLLFLLFRKPVMRLYERLRRHAYGQHLIALEARLKEDIHGHHEDSVAVIKEHVTTELREQDKRLAQLVRKGAPDD